MATSANWTVVFDDKMIIKQTGDAAGTSYTIDDDSFWSQSKFSNIWAIQHGNSVTSDVIEYRDITPHSSFEDANIGDIQDFINKWDSVHLTQLQSNWDNSDAEGETESEKIIRLGARPTSYSS
jgi:hypothetical protein|tara:strand:- start:1068 stop:1436 length:369 start_codon:yes stop_codon:yes gene_type:complete